MRASLPLFFPDEVLGGILFKRRRMIFPSNTLYPFFRAAPLYHFYADGAI